jgi:mannose/fructose/N-acetylgalactosamine-specific phosphotransferase system component IIC
MGAGTPVPPEIRGWNWGGFLMTWIWGIGNNVWISLIALCSVIPYVGWIASLIMMIILGVRGNEWAWQHKKWDSIEHFKSTQRKWMWWGIGVMVASIVFVITLLVLIIALIMISKTLGINSNWQNLVPWHF